MHTPYNEHTVFRSRNCTSAISNVAYSKRARNVIGCALLTSLSGCHATGSAHRMPIQATAVPGQDGALLLVGEVGYCISGKLNTSAPQGFLVIST